VTPPAEFGSWDGHLPHNWPGVAGLVVFGLVVIILAQGVGGGLILRWHKGNAKAAAEDRIEAAVARKEIKTATAAIKDQVVNGHEEPLRDDFDRMAAKQEQQLKDLTKVSIEQARQGAVLQRIEDAVADVREEFRLGIQNLYGQIADERNGRHNLSRELRNTIDAEVADIRGRLPHRGNGH
jgi:hypothetical protein